MRRRFFVEQFEGGRAVLEGDTAYHLGRVLRAEPGQLYELSDGNHLWLARIEEVKQKRIAFSLIEELPALTPTLETTLLLSVVKFDAFEFALEKATELGVSRIVPIAAARSEKALLAAAPKRAERWRRILLEASQQSRRNSIPALAPMTKPESAFSCPVEGLRILLSERPGAVPLRSILEGNRFTGRTTAAAAEEANRTIGDPELRSSTARTTAISLAVGPEGGWTDGEFESARTRGFCEASLGSLILRAETAVIAALASLNYALSPLQATPSNPQGS